MKLKIERLRDFERDPSNNFLTRSEIMEAVKELIALREAMNGEQVPIAIDADVIRDANRYRFLRDEDAWGEDSDSWVVETRTGLISSENLMGGLGSDHFDAAIDARMAASDIPFLNPVTTQQKPVISKEKLCDWLEDNFDIDDSQRDAFAQCFSHHCNCIVEQDIE